MFKYPYHSPVRFYKSKDDLLDMTNPQNAQFFGSGNPYPLEVNDYHRFLIPNYENEIETEDLELWLVGRDEVQIACELGFNNNRLFRVSFLSEQELTGNFEIRNTDGDAIFFSNCVKFVDSTDASGRKFIRVATKNNFDKAGFGFKNSDYDWFITNLPAYDYGLFMIDSDFQTSRNGTMNSLEIKDSYLDEVSTINFIGEGDCNVFNFILFSILNNEFYINGNKVTIKDKPDIDEFMILGKMKFAYNKNKDNFYITLDEESIFDDAFRSAIGNGEKTAVYTYNDNNAIPSK